MRRRRGTLAGLLLLAAAVVPAAAQQSASFNLEEGVLNAGGHPAGGVSPTSAGFRISLDALGDSVGGRALSSASFRMAGGFASFYPPPGEVLGLRFLDSDTLEWDGEPSAGSYALYRDVLTGLGGLGYGSCLTTGITGTTIDDAAVPAAADGYFYLVTVRNRLDEEGTKGFDTIGGERPNAAPCP